MKNAVLFKENNHSAITHVIQATGPNAGRFLGEIVADGGNPCDRRKYTLKLDTPNGAYVFDRAGTMTEARQIVATVWG